MGGVAVGEWEWLIVLVIGILILLVAFLLLYAVLRVVRKITSFAVKVGAAIDRSVSSEHERIRCPECAERIMAEAKKCRFCGAKIDQSE